MSHRHVESARMGRGKVCVVLMLVLPCCLLLPSAAHGQCPGTPTEYENGVIENCVSDYGLNASVAVRSDDYFIVAWQTPWYADPGKLPLELFREDVLVQRFEDDASALGINAYLSDISELAHHNGPSVAMNADGDVRVAWVA